MIVKKLKVSFCLSSLFFIASCSRYYENPVNIVFEEDKAVPSVPIKINGENFTAMIDSGGNFGGYFFKDNLKKTRAKKTNKKSKMCDALGKVMTSDIYMADVQIGNKVFKDVEAIELRALTSHQDPSGALSKMNITSRNLIGLYLLKRKSFLLDLKNKILSFDVNKAEIYKNSDKIEIPFSITENGMEFLIFSDDHSFRCVLDTGCNATVLNDKSLYKIKNIAYENVQQGTMVKNIFVNGKQLKPFPYYAMRHEEPPVDLLLGCDFLIDYIVFFDMINYNIILIAHN